MARSVFLTVVTILLTIAGQVLAQDSPGIRRPTSKPSVTDPDDQKSDLDSDLPSTIDFQLNPKAIKRAKLTNQEKNDFKAARRNGYKLIKLYVAPDCVDKLVVNVGDQRCAENYELLPISFYSFYYGSHGENYGDLRLKEDTIIAGSSLFRQGMLIDLGEIDLASVTETTPEVAALSNYEIATTFKTAEKQRVDLELGIACGPTTTSSRRKLIERHVFLLRAVSYRHSERTLLPYSYDNILVFRVERLTADSMALVLWKKISDKKAPRLQMDKDEKDDNENR